MRYSYLLLLLVLSVASCGGGGSSDNTGTGDAAPRTANQMILGTWSNLEPNTQCSTLWKFSDPDGYSSISLDKRTSGTYNLSTTADGSKTELTLHITTDNGLSDCFGGNEDATNTDITHTISLSEQQLTLITADGNNDLTFSHQSDPESNAPDARSQAIEGVAFDYKYDYDYSGYRINVFPIVLFKDGSACTDADILITDLSVEEHRNRYPGYWYRWRRNDSGDLLYAPGQSNNWKFAEYGTAYPPMAAGQTLNLTYSRTSWTGPVPVGTSVSASNSLSFSENGRFVAGYSISSTTQGPLIGDSGFTGVSADEQGTYYINGYRLTLQFDDGTTKVMSIITDDLENPTTIWLNGYDYNS